jgi:hypothetical protein
LIEVPSIKFELFIPTSYLDKKTRQTKFVQRSEIIKHLVRMMNKYKKFGGYTISNPFAPPPYAGGYRGGPLERSTVVMLIVPDQLFAQAEQDVKDLIVTFQSKYQQLEILAYQFAVLRYMPQQRTSLTRDTA